MNIKPFGWLAEQSPALITELIADESPQVQALVLSQLNAHSRISNLILECIAGSEDKRADIVERMRTIRPVNSDVMREVERVLERKAEQLPHGDRT